MLSEEVDRYVELKRSLGFKFRTQSCLLRNFVRFAEERGRQFIHTSCVLDWAGQAPSPQQRRNRLLTVRRFALAAIAEDARHQVPPAGTFGNLSFTRIRPHIYSSSELADLLNGAVALSPAGSIRPAAYVTLFGLLAATGLRISEALALQLDDLNQDGLIVRETKFQKSRLVPLHETSWRALDRYLEARSRLNTVSQSLFVSEGGKPLGYNTVANVFRTLACETGLREKNGHHGPRIHDLRHTFAVRSIERCAGNPNAIRRHMAALSTYLGHAHVSDTYWYLQATPELLRQIAGAGEELHTGGRS
ncbi:MAG: tyrosine-type recombinase/integrase [Pirellulaceae bacterium]|jgi:integrase|nr:tyrosine-type recombinase/integrase [Pirellulaceae bacterium]